MQSMRWLEVQLKAALQHGSCCAPPAVLLNSGLQACLVDIKMLYRPADAHSLWVQVKVPPTLRFVMDGQMPHHLLAKDLILQIIGEITVAGAGVVAAPVQASSAAGQPGM